VRTIGVSSNSGYAFRLVTFAAAGVLAAGTLMAQPSQPQVGPVPALPPARAAATPPTGPLPAAAAPTGVPIPAGYVIGPEDILTVVFWRDKDMSGDTIVRPDGMITLPLVNDILAAGLTPEQLRERVTTEAGKYIEEPNVSVVVKAINSRKVFITGQVNKPGMYPLAAPTTVVQLIALAGGLLEFADGKNIVIMRTENGRQVAYRFNYKDVLGRKNLKQNIELKPGDTVVVP
jgi:polysaccharide export outer membrane protein